MSRLTDPSQLAEFFRLARERESMRRKKEAGEPWPWTDEPALRDYHTCNVDRDDDKVSRVIMGEVMPAARSPWVVAFVGRTINRAESILALFPGGELRSDWREVVLDREGFKLNTRAYKIHTPRGLWSREGIVELVENALAFRWPDRADTLQGAAESYLAAGLGPFASYQAAQDLRGSSVMSGSPADRGTYFLRGHGTTRGALRLMGLDLNGWSRAKEAELLAKVGPLDALGDEERGKYQRQLQKLRSLDGKGIVDTLVRDLVPGSPDPDAIVGEVLREVIDLSGDEEGWQWAEWPMPVAANWCCEFDKHLRWRDRGPSNARRYRPPLPPLLAEAASVEPEPAPAAGGQAELW